MFSAFGQVYVLDDLAYTDEELLAQCLDHRVDTVFCSEYSGHRDFRSRLFRHAGINYWHHGLGVVDHYETSRFDWGLYTDDTYLRYVTSPQRMAAEAAIATGQPIRKVLIIGQVTGDQALQYGSRGYDSLRLVKDVRTILPDAEIKYRPHPKTLNRVKESREVNGEQVYNDPYLQHPIDGVKVDKGKLSFGWPDATVTINSTAAYESLMASVPVYNAGVPMLHEHPGGNLLLDYLDEGAKVVTGDYLRALKPTLSRIQSSKFSAYEAEFWLQQERDMLITYGDMHKTTLSKPNASPPMNVQGKCLGKIEKFAEDFQPTDKVLVVGSGPTALYIDKVDLSKYTVISVNAGCGVVDADLFLVMNIDAWKYPRIWRNLRGNVHLIGHKLLEAAGGYPFDHYEFEHLPPRRNDAKFEAFNLNGAGGISSRAVQLAASFPNVKTIHMIGLDYCNNRTHYYDYQEPPTGPPQKPFGSMAAGMNMVLGSLDPRISLGHYGPSSLCRLNKAVKQLLPGTDK